MTPIYYSGGQMRFYFVRTESNGYKTRHYADFYLSESRLLSVEISETIKDALIDLQREYWRLEKREQRHSVHFDAIPEAFVHYGLMLKTPEEILIEKYEARALLNSLFRLPAKQQRRMLLRHIYDLPIRKIAEIEKCSERAIKYSLTLAKNNLRELLDEMDLVSMSY